MTGWVKRRSTRTTTVLSCLSLTTTPCSMRFGISRLLRLGFRARGALLRPGRLLARGRRLAGALLRRDGLDPRDVAANLSHARGVLELTRRPLEAQVEPLLLQLLSLVVELIEGHVPEIIGLHGHSAPGLFRDALDEARLDRQLGGGEPERLARNRHRHAVDLEQHASGLDPGDPEFRRALARAHAHFERLLRYRHVRIDPDPDPAGAFHVAGE